MISIESENFDLNTMYMVYMDFTCGNIVLIMETGILHHFKYIKPDKEFISTLNQSMPYCIAIDGCVAWMRDMFYISNKSRHGTIGFYGTIAITDITFGSMSKNLRELKKIQSAKSIYRGVLQLVGRDANLAHVLREFTSILTIKKCKFPMLVLSLIFNYIIDNFLH